ncbi:MAG: MBL fold metallo-hydrolase [Phenylobacterium sp.]|uniref:MBL fold metallo-hydrolase n=1 Tax=Phenylobacterium sp. TaxID=1871053 RepID=UPI0027244977|nr:MBL fold metallo-hydrolase [Phenylobacterium sp.]MDO8410492.1 MBL fold metallo-hydrolase [Phenylobacterium sp.]
MSVQHHSFFHEPTSTVTYLVWDEATRAAAVIDPVLDYEPRAAKVSGDQIAEVLRFLEDHGLSLAYVLETHAHADHLTAAARLREATGAKVVIGAHITAVQDYFGKVFGAGDVTPDGAVFDRLVQEGDTLMLGETPIGVLHTPGHTPACVTYLIDGAAFVGDTLFMPDYGTARADFPGGDAATLYRSIQKILALPPETRIFVGHDYLTDTRQTHAWETTVAAQAAENIHLRGGVTEAEFVARREARDATLPPPVLILPSLQVNIRAGDLPPAEADGRVYLRLPVTLT